MDKKIKHRILGFSVIIGLVIILLPFLQSSEELPPEAAIIKAPAFPTLQTAALATAKIPLRPDENSLNKNETPSVASATILNENKENSKISDDSLSVQPATTLTPKNNFSADSVLPANKNKAVLKSKTWVVQIGSFKNKANALRLVNQLRADGYRAFIQQNSNVSGSIRVFVGPENKREDAYLLANRLKNNLNIQGIIIIYKPLTI